jgi:hypothetical protein
MTADNTNKRTPSAKRKLIPATAMLLASALALSSSTYAWFTMSREVEVQNIQMVATVPEDIQISLGALAEGELNLGTGTLPATTAKASTASVPTKDTDWSNTADIGKYYEFGRLIPASSKDGVDIFFTPDADGVGKTVKANAKYYQADGGTDSESKSYQATAHTYQTKTGASAAADEWSGYTKNTGWNTTKDDGYYIDIPVWFRTSSKSVVGLQVEGYVIAGDTDANKVATSTTALEGVTEQLSKAVRVAVLDSTAANSVSKIIPLTDTGFGTGTAITGNYYNRSGQTGAVASVTSNVPTYSAADIGVKADDTITVTAAAENNNGYGAPIQYTIRVWLEGEDQDCWNATAGQDWKIALKFTNPAGDAYPT